MRFFGMATTLFGAPSPSKNSPHDHYGYGTGQTRPQPCGNMKCVNQKIKICMMTKFDTWSAF